VKSLFAILIFAVVASAASAAVTPLPGTTPQRAVAMTPFASAFAVKVTDDRGAPVSGAEVLYVDGLSATELAQPSAVPCYIDLMIVYVCRVSTDAEGVARFPKLRGRFAGHFQPAVKAYSGSTRLGDVFLDLTVDAVQAPARMSVVSGNGQRVVIGTQLAPIVVRLDRPSGQPVAGATLYYEPMTFGAGGFNPPLNATPAVITDAAGLAVLPTFIAGWDVGSHQAKVRYFDNDAREYVEAQIEYTATNAQGGLDLDFQDLWWSGPVENGWGMSVVQHGAQLFNVFFVYDDAGKPTWYVQPGGTWGGGVGGSFYGSVYSPRGAPWFAYDASRLQVGSAVGNAQLAFRGPEAGVANMNVDLGREFRSVQKNIVRQDFRRALVSPIRGVGDMWWGGPQQNGWGIAVMEQQGSLFMVWFTYDANGAPTWFVMPGGDWSDSNTFTGTIYRTSGSAWLGVAYDASRLQVGAVGTFHLRFDGTQHAIMEYSLDGRSASLDLVRQPF
jgi:hypothetical protein